MKRKSFTILELLIVMTVIAILAGISVPNFLDAQNRSKVARTHTDMAVVSAALRAYFADYNVYPGHNAELRTMLRAMGDDPTKRVGDFMASENDTATSAEMEMLSPIDFVYSSGRYAYDDDNSPYGKFANAGRDLSVLTTPLAYFTFELPTDNFSQGNDPFIYINYREAFDEPTDNYLLLSFGPDRMFDPVDSNTNAAHFRPTRYDPTNGVVSLGDIFELR